MKKYYFYLIIAGLSLATVNAGCGSKKSEKETEKNAPDSSSTQTADSNAVAQMDITEAQEFFSSLPSPIHLARIFQKSGLKYVPNLGHSPEKASSYQSSEARSYNLGIYLSNLAYASLNEQNQTSLDYFKTVKEIAQGLNMASIYENNGYLPRFEKNLGNRDSLVSLLSELKMESDLLLTETKRYDVIYQGFAGAWVESIYLSTKILDKQQNTELTNRVLSQAPTLSKLISIMEKLPQTGSTPTIIKDMKDINTELNALSNMGAKVSDAAFQKAFKEKLAVKVSDLRNKIISLS